MEDNLHNDNLEDFFRKSLHNFEDNPDDGTWGNIAPFIVPVGTSEVASLQNRIQQLSNQNVLLKSLLAAMSMVLITLAILQPFNQNNQQQKITLLGQQLAQQNQTIDALTNKIDSLYDIDNQNVAANTSMVSNSQTSDKKELQNNLKQDVYSMTEKGKRFNTSSVQSNNFRAKTNTTDYQNPAMEGKTPFSSNNTFQNPKRQPRGFRASYPISNIEALPFLLIEEKNLEMMALQQTNTNEWKKDIEEKEKKKRLKIQLPNLNLTSIIENLTATAYLQLGNTENHFNYEDSFLGEELAKINGKFKEDVKMQQYGVLLGYKIDPRLQIESGIGKLNYSQNLGEIEIEGIYTQPDSNGALTFNDQFYTSYSDNQLQFILDNVAQQFPDASIGDTLRVPIRLEQELTYISVPLAVKYNIGEKKRLNFYIKGGIAANFLTENELDIESTHPSFGKHDISSAKGLTSVYFTYQLEGGLQYQLSKKLQLQVAPYFMGSLSQLTENLPVIAYPSTNGLRFGVNVGL